MSKLRCQSNQGATDKYLHELVVGIEVQEYFHELDDQQRSSCNNYCFNEFLSI